MSQEALSDSFDKQIELKGPWQGESTDTPNNSAVL